MRQYWQSLRHPSVYHIWGATCSWAVTRANMNPNLGHPFVLSFITEEIKTQSLLSCNTEGHAFEKTTKEMTRADNLVKLFPDDSTGENREIYSE